MTRHVEGYVLVYPSRLDPSSNNAINFCMVGHVVKDKSFLAHSSEYLNCLIANWNGQFLLCLLQVQSKAISTLWRDI